MAILTFLRDARWLRGIGQTPRISALNLRAPRFHHANKESIENAEDVFLARISCNVFTTFVPRRAVILANVTATQHWLPWRLDQPV